MSDSGSGVPRRSLPSLVSVVVRTSTTERWPDLLAALASLELQTRMPGEIIVVVDHNPAISRRLGTLGSAVLAVENRGRQGASGAMNCGVATARGDIVAFLDDDAVAEPDWLEHLIAAYSDSAVLGVGGMIYPLWSSARPHWFPDEFLWVVGAVHRGARQDAGPVRNLIGANMSFRREVLQGAGGFCEEVGSSGGSLLRCEDTEFSIRAQQQFPDGRLVFAPLAKVWHRVPPLRARWQYFRRRCYAEGQSKAMVARLVGTADGLSSERNYIRRALPRGLARGLGDAVFRQDWAGPARSAAIVAGLTFTAAGYVAGRVASRPGKNAGVTSGMVDVTPGALDVAASGD